MSDQLSSHPAFESWPTGKLLTAAARLVEHAFDTAISELGVTHAGINVLDALAEGPQTQRSLASLCAVQEQTMSRILEGLERAGHIGRTRDPADRRKVIVERTGQGKEILDRAREAGRRLNLFEDDDSEETRACREALVKLISKLKPCPRG
jgi:MarR family transcriptional regulator, organic hydroperoxide resistance regulator